MSKATFKLGDYVRLSKAAAEEVGMTPDRYGRVSGIESYMQFPICVRSAKGHSVRFQARELTLVWRTARPKLRKGRRQ